MLTETRGVRSLSIGLPPNPRLQRTRVRAPLSRKPLGGTKGHGRGASELLSGSAGYTLLDLLVLVAGGLGGSLLADLFHGGVRSIMRIVFGVAGALIAWSLFTFLLAPLIERWLKRGKSGAA